MMIANKQQMYALMQQNRFGNRLRIWRSWQEFDTDTYQGRVGLRSKFPGGPFHYNLDRDTARSIHGDFIISETPDDEKLILQGEIETTSRGIYLYYSMARAPMREALSSTGRSLEGLMATNLLKSAMCPGSYDDLQTLLELYPTAVIEFSTYRYNLGIVPRRNTVIWEVRDY